MLDDPRLKRVISFYDKLSDDLAGEVEVTGLSPSEIRQHLGVDPGDTLVGVFDVSAEAAARFADTLGLRLDTERFDYFFETVVRLEYAASYYRDERPPYPPPETLPAFPNAKRTRPRS